MEVIIGLKDSHLTAVFLFAKANVKKTGKGNHGNGYFIGLTRKHDFDRMVTIQKSADGKKYKFRCCPESRCMVKTGEKRIWKFFPELLR